MQNAIKTTLPSEKQIDKLLREIKEVSDALNQYVLDLTPHQKRSFVKPRPGGEKVAALITELAAQHKLDVAGASPAAIEANRVRATRLRPLESATSALARSLGDAVFDAESKAWSATTNLYSTLRSMSRKDPTLQARIEPARQFFATGKRKPKAPPAAR